MSDICALALFPFSYSGQACPQPVGENVKELAKLKHFVTGRHICKVNPGSLSGCSLPAPHKTAVKKNSFSLFPVEKRPQQLPAFPVSPAGGAHCVHKGWRDIKEATISEGKALLVLPFPCSFCPGWCLSVPLTRQVLLFAEACGQSGQSVGAGPAGGSWGVSPPGRCWASLLCPSTAPSSPAPPGLGQPEVLPNPVWNAAVKDYGRIWFRHQGLQAL